MQGVGLQPVQEYYAPAVPAMGTHVPSAAT
jgi:hypothetical protein